MDNRRNSYVRFYCSFAAKIHYNLYSLAIVLGGITFEYFYEGLGDKGQKLVACLIALAIS